ncbi:hypothetical protein GO685_04970 [Wolbachia endosymbiont of Madathamugadia hiepei]|uniref:hypothetical protein n=1 Tax=Wolbachia endosymbiont of Madathamugadia hiepei TaxID=1241303 RepID=UPI00158DC2A1|nr:hypothetical protein [Wolbachia endosymbiont of Madathamugadia hiepei]NUX01803.1 hypothetical protein [Wolbachia endosymbiont of Madathamugadia hiepei]
MVGNAYSTGLVILIVGDPCTSFSANRFFSSSTSFSSLEILSFLSSSNRSSRLVSVKKVYHEKIRKDVAKTGSLT